MTGSSSSTSASRTVQVFTQEDGRYSAKDFGSSGDTIKVDVPEGCAINLSAVFGEEDGQEY